MTLLSHAHTVVAPRADTLTDSTAPKAYLIGLSTFQQQPLLGTYDQGNLRLNDCGLIVADEWVRSAASRKGIAIDAWSITPNRLQSIVFLDMPTTAAVGLAGGMTGHSSQKPWLLSSFIASFKAAAAKRINLRLNQVGQSVWQRNYEEHLIVDEAHLCEVRTQLQSVR
ncbi:transposase [Leptolyngbya sp. KIOST-1]|uniref:transposase n=1 Tax=Leptolyngbya sp. KIOST-1 TaxID=1229172 RepID=UPI0012E024C6|nr:transposase [Leptolyngbya sp. KIOST-1]